MKNLYFTAPPHKQFNECREKCIEIWETYDDTYGYATEKINQIKEILNIRDNFMYMVAMFDHDNQLKLAGKLSESTKKAIADRLSDGGTPDFLNPFLVKKNYEI